MRKHTQSEEYSSKGRTSPASCISAKSPRHPKRLRHAWKGPVFVSSPLQGTVQPTELADITLQLSLSSCIFYFSLWLDHATRRISAGMEVSPPAVDVLNHRTITQVSHPVSSPPLFSSSHKPYLTFCTWQNPAPFTPFPPPTPVTDGPTRVLLFTRHNSLIRVSSVGFLDSLEASSKQL